MLKKIEPKILYSLKINSIVINWSMHGIKFKFITQLIIMLTENLHHLSKLMINLTFHLYYSRLFYTSIYYLNSLVFLMPLLLNFFTTSREDLWLQLLSHLAPKLSYSKILLVLFQLKIKYILNLNCNWYFL